MSSYRGTQAEEPLTPGEKTTQGETLYESKQADYGSSKPSDKTDTKLARLRHHRSERVENTQGEAYGTPQEQPSDEPREKGVTTQNHVRSMIEEAGGPRPGPNEHHGAIAEQSASQDTSGGPPGVNKLPASRSTEHGTGEEYVQSSGFMADGGDFDAANPGAGKEAHRL